MIAVTEVELLQSSVAVQVYVYTRLQPITSSVTLEVIVRSLSQASANAGSEVNIGVPLKIAQSTLMFSGALVTSGAVVSTIVTTRVTLVVLSQLSAAVYTVVMMVEQSTTSVVDSSVKVNSSSQLSVQFGVYSGVASPHSTTIGSGVLVHTGATASVRLIY